MLIDSDSLTVAKDRKYRLSEKGLARVREDIMSTSIQTVPPEQICPKDEDPWKRPVNSNIIMPAQDALNLRIKAAKFNPSTVSLLTEKEKGHIDFSDFEDDYGVITSLWPSADENDVEKQ
ncbi:hypothetical protein PHMEG_0008917 [Phytophthora megakarya]|uniref:Uncharacterized protein n=1 Tax=Phytophthora megakarya TaxID=4795 RepID=A0A225WHI5_9STRA|nr:hypothetical protein PHMEG_0008917 [Phytophthora megakarya]